MGRWGLRAHLSVLSAAPGVFASRLRALRCRAQTLLLPPTRAFCLSLSRHTYTTQNPLLLSSRDASFLRSHALLSKDDDDVLLMRRDDERRNQPPKKEHGLLPPQLSA